MIRLIQNYKVQSEILQYFKLTGQVKSYAIFLATRMSQKNIFLFSLIIFGNLYLPSYIINLIQLVVQSLLNGLFFIFIYNINISFLFFVLCSYDNEWWKKLQYAPFYATYGKDWVLGQWQKKLMMYKSQELSTKLWYKTDSYISKKVSPALKINQGQRDFPLWQLRPCLNWLNKRQAEVLVHCWCFTKHLQSIPQ